MCPDTASESVVSAFFRASATSPTFLIWYALQRGRLVRRVPWGVCPGAASASVVSVFGTAILRGWNLCFFSASSKDRARQPSSEHGISDFCFCVLRGQSTPAAFFRRRSHKVGGATCEGAGHLGCLGRCSFFCQSRKEIDTDETDIDEKKRGEDERAQRSLRKTARCAG